MSKRGRKRKLTTEDKAIFEWEKDRILPENLRDEMETMWEIPQIYHFLQLVKDALNISHMSMYEVERMLLMPKASKQLAHIMTCLLSSPSTTKSKLQRIPPMPYEFWTNILMYKLRSWFKMYQTKHEDSVKVFDTLGVEPEFWKIFPDANDIEGKDFMDFNFRQRVWLLKTVCDTAMHSRKTIQDEIAKQPWESQFETVLGIDRYGARYIYFPQFLHNDLRVYKHCLNNKVLSTVKAPVVEVKPKVEVVLKEEPKVMPRIGSKKKRRKSRWSNGSLPQKKRDKKKLVASSIDPSNIDSGSNSSFAKTSGYETNMSTDANGEKSEHGCNEVKGVSELMEDLKAQIEEDVKSSDERKEETKSEKEETMGMDSLDNSTKVFLRTDEVPPKETSFTTVDDLSKSSKTDDEKLEEMASKTTDKAPDSDAQIAGIAKDVNISKSDDEKLSESIKCDTSGENESVDDNANEDEEDEIKKEGDKSKNNSDDEGEYSDSTLSNCGTRRSARIKTISEIKTEIQEAEDFFEVCESDELSSVDLRDSLCRVSSPEDERDYFNEDDWKVENFNELIDELRVSNFQLVADSLDSLRDLTEFISSDRTIPGQDIKQADYKRPVCEEKLLKRMKVLSTSLEKVESILKESAKKARNKLQREWSNYENGATDEDQDGNGDNDGTNRWVVGSQGVPLHLQLGAGAITPALSHSSVSSTSPREPDSDPLAPDAAAPANTPGEQQRADKDDGEANRSAGSLGCPAGGKGQESGCKEEKKSEGEGGVGEEKARGGEGEAGEEAEDEEEEPRPTRRVLRARGVSSYTEQLFSDDESEEDKLDGWADIEAVYAPACPPDGSPSTGSQQASSSADRDYPPDESEEEDSDQDWILPSSRKRNRKRASASRRLKSFQHKLQNINATQGADGQQQSQQQQQQQFYPCPSKDTQVTSSTHLISSTRHVPSRLPPYKLSSSPVKAAATTTVPGIPPLVPLSVVKTEAPDPSLHSVLDIKDEGPIYDSSNANQDPNCVQQQQPNYVVVTTGHAPVANYYVMQQNPPVTAVVQQSQFMQPAAFVSQMVSQPQVQPMQAMSANGGGYYVQPPPPQNYIVQNSPSVIATGPRPAFIASSNPPPLVYQQQQPTPQMIPAPPPGQGYVQYVAAPMQQQPAQPRIINTMTLSPPRQINYRMRAPGAVGQPMQGNRMPVPRPGFPQPPNGAVIRSAPISNVLRPGQRAGQPKSVAPKRQANQKVHKATGKATTTTTSSNKGQNPASIVVLSDSDDDIQMIVPSKSNASLKKRAAAATPAAESPQKSKPSLPAELLQRMNEGGISISPIKPAQPATSTSQNTQLVVVVNETGSHYALALPNGSKLILTPEQVAQIRASNGGKLVL